MELQNESVPAHPAACSGPGPREPQRKILARPAMIRERQRLREQGVKVAFTNGCFDILHAGHVDYLAFARRQGDVLVVGLNSDASVRAFKDPARPIVPQQQRAALLAALEAVDYVVIFDEPRVDGLLADLLPDVLVKGADWGHDVHGRDVVEAHGGRVQLAPILPGLSTSALINTIVERFGHRAAVSHTRKDGP